MNDVVLRNARAEQYLCGARKNFILRSAPDCLSESSSKIVIGHITDLHGDVKRFENAMALFSHIRPAFVMHTGDLVTWNMEDDTDFFYDGIRNFDVPVYNCIGNHDTFNNAGFIPRAQLDEKMIQPLKGICDTHQRGYYYVDFEEAKLRLIVLNPYDDDASENYYYSQTQCDWLCETLKQASEKNLGVILAGHEFDENPVNLGANSYGFCQRYAPAPWGGGRPRPTVILDIVDAFRNGRSLEKTYKFWNTGLPKVTVSYQFQQKGEFICYLCGHCHADYTGYMPSYQDQLCFLMTLSGCFPEGYKNIGEESSDLPRIPGTVSEDAVNFYVIDRKNKTVTVVRFGASVNDLLEERLVARFPYEKT